MDLILKYLLNACIIRLGDISTCPIPLKIKAVLIFKVAIVAANCKKKILFIFILSVPKDKIWFNVQAYIYILLTLPRDGQMICLYRWKRSNNNIVNMPSATARWSNMLWNGLEWPCNTPTYSCFQVLRTGTWGQRQSSKNNTYVIFCCCCCFSRISL